MAERSNYDSGNSVPGWVRLEMRDLFEKPRILLVEDDTDIRDLLVTLLEMGGFSIFPCQTAELALEQLREHEFDLVLTDYALPGRSGGWLLQEAGAEGLLDATPTLVVTAHPNPPGLGGFEIIQKPFDLDELVERVRQRLEGDRPRSTPLKPQRAMGPGGGHGSGRGSGASDGHGNGHGNRDHGDGRPKTPREPVELVLYVSMHSPRSAAAIRNIKQALSGYTSSKVKLTICDLSKDPSQGAADAVAFTPTLVKRSPGPRTFILGHLDNPDLVLDLLTGHGD